MAIWDAVIPMGPEAGAAIRDLLERETARAGPLPPELVQAVAGRLFQDLGRLPWGDAVLEWLAATDPRRAEEFRQHLETAVRDPRPAVAHGALLLMMALAEQGHDLDDLMFHIARTHSHPAIQRRAGAYLLATPRTRGRALAELTGIGPLADLVDRVNRLAGSRDVWRRLVAHTDPDQVAAHIRAIIANNPDLLFELENDFLVAAGQMPPPVQHKWIDFLLDALKAKDEAVQVFALDVLTHPPLMAAAMRRAGYRLGRLLHRLVRNPGTAERVRHYAEALLAAMETGAALESLPMAARGQLEALTDQDRQIVEEILDAARDWFSHLELETLVTIETRAHRDPKDYAHAVLTAVFPSPRFPVPVEELCRRLGVALYHCRFSANFDGLVLQVPHLPGPVVAVNTSGGRSEARIRFTVAHELGHVVLPWHADRTVHVSTVREATPDSRAAPPVPAYDRLEQEVAATTTMPADLRRMEREADQFAAALLMPSPWFGHDAGKAPFTPEGLAQLCTRYGVSLTAAAFNAIAHTREPVALVYSVGGQVRYFRCTDEFKDAVGHKAEPHFEVQPDTLAFDLVRSAGPRGETGRAVAAGRWFTGTKIDVLQEYSVRTHGDQVLTILAVPDTE